MLYLIGQPGAGKSTLAALLVDGLVPLSIEERPFAHTLWPGGVAELGARREKFSGTDALSMSVQPRVVEWLRNERPPYVLAEGDRLANGRFFNEVLGSGYRLTVARLAVSAVVAQHRREQRADALGTGPQNPGWVKGRISKAANLAEQWRSRLLELDADQSPQRLLAELVASGEPVTRVLRSQP